MKWPWRSCHLFVDIFSWKSYEIRGGELKLRRESFSVFYGSVISRAPKLHAKFPQKGNQSVFHRFPFSSHDLSFSNPVFHALFIKRNLTKRCNNPKKNNGTKKNIFPDPYSLARKSNFSSDLWILNSINFDFANVIQ